MVQKLQFVNVTRFVPKWESYGFLLYKHFLSQSRGGFYFQFIINYAQLGMFMKF
jgi:hypothetical protein